MSIFEPVTITWGDEEYTVPSDKVMRLIAVIEDHLRINDLVSEKGPALAKLACAYGSVLRFAGARVSDDEVYHAFFSKGPDVAVELTTALLSMMIPPESLKGGGEKKRVE